MRARSLVLLALCVPALAAAEPPPVESFTNFPKFESLKISPGGEYLAFTRHTTEWGEGHGFFDEKNRKAAYELMLKFFAKHIGSTGTP